MCQTDTCAEMQIPIDVARHSGMISFGVWCLCWPTQVRSFGFQRRTVPAERTAMRHVREVRRLKFVGGVPTREIARRIGVASSTVRATLKRFQTSCLSWPLPEEMTDAIFEVMLFATSGRSRAIAVVNNSATVKYIPFSRIETQSIFLRHFESLPRTDLQTPQ
jgi:hypothetical protein